MNWTADNVIFGATLLDAAMARVTAGEFHACRGQASAFEALIAEKLRQVCSDVGDGWTPELVYQARELRSQANDRLPEAVIRWEDSEGYARYQIKLRAELVGMWYPLVRLEDQPENQRKETDNV